MPIARDVILLSVPTSYPTLYHSRTHVDTMESMVVNVLTANPFASVFSY